MQVNAIGSMRRRKRGARDEKKAAVLPSQLDGEHEDEQDAPRCKKLNNSTIMPLKYSRYINDDN
jgi:hypothetical protein